MTVAKTAQRLKRYFFSGTTQQTLRQAPSEFWPYGYRLGVVESGENLFEYPTEESEQIKILFIPEGGSAVFQQPYFPIEISGTKAPAERKELHIEGGSAILPPDLPWGVQVRETLLGHRPSKFSSWAEEFRKQMEGYFGATGSSTLPLDQPGEITNELEILFDKAKEEVFEDGMESEFSKNLVFLINKYGNAAIGVLERLIGAEQVNTEVASETMRWLGHLEHPITYRSRLRLLERSLHNSSTRVRDGAALGLASLDDPHAIPYLKRAIEREEYEELRHDLEQVLTQLESTNSAFYSENNT